METEKKASFPVMCSFQLQSISEVVTARARRLARFAIEAASSEGEDCCRVYTDVFQSQPLIQTHRWVRILFRNVRVGEKCTRCPGTVRSGTRCPGIVRSGTCCPGIVRSGIRCSRVVGSCTRCPWIVGSGIRPRPNRWACRQES